jgi:hypothetical protein
MSAISFSNSTPGEYHVTVTHSQAGTYAVSLDGAQGGAGDGAAGGGGGAVNGDIVLTSGEQLEIVIGGVGGASAAGGGGGGASYIVETYTGSTDVYVVLAAAGGGGGGGGAWPTSGPGTGSPGHVGSGAGVSGIGGDPGSPGVSIYIPPPGPGIIHVPPGAGGAGGSYLNGTAGPVTNQATGGASSEDSTNNGDGKVTLLPCFASGTRIRTVRGEIAVEDLQAGEEALTASGEARPIVWIGHLRVERPSLEQQPVRVLAGAFGEGLPARDLVLSHGHAVCVDVVGEVFVPAGELVNGLTIVREQVSEVTYWHVELESHDVLLAEGLPAESYLDTGNRAFFGRAYGRLASVEPDRTLADACRPFVAEGPIMAAIGERLMARAGTIGPATEIAEKAA